MIEQEIEKIINKILDNRGIATKSWVLSQFVSHTASSSSVIVKEKIDTLEKQVRKLFALSEKIKTEKKPFNRFEEFKQAVNSLNAHVNDPQPGMFCWHEILDIKMKIIQELYSKKQEKQK